MNRIDPGLNLDSGLFDESFVKSHFNQVTEFEDSLQNSEIRSWTQLRSPPNRAQIQLPSRPGEKIVDNFISSFQAIEN